MSSNKGYLPHEIIKAIAFWTISICILVATIAGIAHAWDIIGEPVTSRCLFTCFCLACGTSAFLFVNLLFGEFGKSLVSSREPSEPLDPAFADRLQKAKAARETIGTPSKES